MSAELVIEEVRGSCVDIYGNIIDNIFSCCDGLAGERNEEFSAEAIAVHPREVSYEEMWEIEEWLYKRYGQYMETDDHNGNGHVEEEVVLPVSKSPRWKGHTCIRKQVHSRLGKL
jgi:hypothetical protein